MKNTLYYTTPPIALPPGTGDNFFNADLLADADHMHNAAGFASIVNDSDALTWNFNTAVSFIAAVNGSELVIDDISKMVTLAADLNGNLAGLTLQGGTSPNIFLGSLNTSITIADDTGSGLTGVTIDSGGAGGDAGFFGDHITLGQANQGWPDYFTIFNPTNLNSAFILTQDIAGATDNFILGLNVLTPTHLLEIWDTSGGHLFVDLDGFSPTPNLTFDYIDRVLIRNTDKGSLIGLMINYDDQFIALGNTDIVSIDSQTGWKIDTSADVLHECSKNGNVVTEGQTTITGTVDTSVTPIIDFVNGRATNAHA